MHACMRTGTSHSISIVGLFVSASCTAVNIICTSVQVIYVRTVHMVL